MATLKIEPIPTTTSGNYRACITGIDPTDHDCIVGQYWVGKDGPHDGRWNLSGIMRGGSDTTNFDPRKDEIRDAIDLARHLGAQ